jgi:hypothetical protein
MASNTQSRWSTFALFLSGLFAGGAIDHLILAGMGQPLTPYGVAVGVGGNWALAGLDVVLTVGCLAGYRHRKT